MKKSTKLRRDRKRQLKKARRVAIDFGTELPVKGLMGPRYQLHFAMLDDAVGFKPGELAAFPRVRRHYPSTMGGVLPHGEEIHRRLVEFKTEGVLQEADRCGYVLVTFTHHVSWITSRQLGVATASGCDDICTVALYGVPEKVVGGEAYLLQFESFVRHRMFAHGSTFTWRVGGTQIEAACLVVVAKDPPEWKGSIEDEILQIRKKQFHEDEDKALMRELSKATQVNTSPLPTVSKEELALLTAADALCHAEEYDEDGTAVATYERAKADFMATRKEF